MKPNSTAEASRLILQGQKKKALSKQFADTNPLVQRSDLLAADAMEDAGHAYLALKQIPERGTGGELVPPDSRGLIGQQTAVQCTDAVTLEASIERVGLLDECGAFNIGLDAAEAMEARNANERMLAHQMGAAHVAAMKALARASGMRDTVEQARLLNAASRLMETFQKAMQTVPAARRGGQQIVTVQHVQINEGAQAIVNGAVSGASPGSEGKK